MFVMKNSTIGRNVGATYHVARNQNAATSGDQIDSVEKQREKSIPSLTAPCRFLSIPSLRKIESLYNAH